VTSTRRVGGIPLLSGSGSRWVLAFRVLLEGEEKMKSRGKVVLCIAGLATALLGFGCGDDNVGTVLDAQAAPTDTVADGGEDVGTDLNSKDLMPPPIPADITLESLLIDPGGEVVVPELPDGIRVRVGSYNVYGLKFADAATIGAFLGTLELDLVGLQECPGSAAAEIAAAGGFAEWYGAGTVLLSKTPLEGAQTVSLNAGRSFVHATTTIHGTDFSFYCAHLGWNLEGDLQCREFVDAHLALDPNPYLVLVGDFNDEHLSSQNTILEEVVAGAFAAMGWYPGQRISWPSTGFDDTEGSQLIDLVFFRKDFPAIVVEAQVVNLAPVLSDHKPVSAELLFPLPGEAPFSADPLAPLRDPVAMLPLPEELPENLLLNPGAEEGLNHWQTAGNPVAVAERSRATPRTGERFFTGFAQTAVGGNMLSSGAQNVDLAGWSDEIDGGLAELYVAGYTAIGYPSQESGGVVANMPSPYDDVEIITTLLDSVGAESMRITSGRRDALGWFPYGARIPLLPGTRAARLTWTIHHRGVAQGNDGAVDDLYVGVGIVEEPTTVLGGNLLENAGAEEEESAGWSGEGWVRVRDLDFLGPWGLMLFPPATWSGGGMFSVGAWPAGRFPAAIGTWEVSQEVDLSPWRGRIDAPPGSGGLAIRWGGWLRTRDARGSARLLLEILDRDGAVWSTVESEAVAWAEWTPVEGLVKLPKGTAGVRLRIEGELPDEKEGLFADELFLIPEIPPAQ
jgi:maltose 6'-phosphate phosphatase